MTTKFLRQHKRRSITQDDNDINVFYISKDQNDTTYYVKGSVNQAVTWTNRRVHALQFFSESGVQYYIRHRLGSREDIYLTAGPAEGVTFYNE